MPTVKENKKITDMTVGELKSLIRDVSALHAYDKRRGAGTPTEEGPENMRLK